MLNSHPGLDPFVARSRIELSFDSKRHHEEAFHHGFVHRSFVWDSLSSRVQTEVPKPPPELRKLDYFTGTWAAEGEIKPGTMGSGGKFTGTNQVQWMDGGFFLVTRSEFSGATGKGAETSYMGYDSNEKVYTYDSFNTPGEVDHARGNGRRHLDLEE
jgi:hypothetical protein